MAKDEAGEQRFFASRFGAGNQLVNKDNQLVYQGEETGELQYNELQIPVGGEYQVKLADGTIVRLNSGSSRYPVAFRREVKWC